MKNIHHVGATVSVPFGFSGWWCERCEKPAPGIPEEAEGPAKCPHCRKWTAMWIPPAAMEDRGWKMEDGALPPPRISAETMKGWFVAMHAAADGVEVNEVKENENWQEYL